MSALWRESYGKGRVHYADKKYSTFATWSNIANNVLINISSFLATLQNYKISFQLYLFSFNCMSLLKIPFRFFSNAVGYKAIVSVYTEQFPSTVLILIADGLPWSKRVGMWAMPGQWRFPKLFGSVTYMVYK